MIDVDVIGMKAAKIGCTSLNQGRAERAEIVRSLAHAERGLCRNQNRSSTACHGLAQDFLGSALRIDVRGVEKIDASFKANIHQASSFGNVAVAPGREEVAASAK